MKAPRALIITGDGINCENETAYACRIAGFESTTRHINDLISEKMSQEDLERNFDLLVFPGGFSFGDELGSGRVLALKIIHGLKWDLLRFSEARKLVLGICNGFQALIQMKVFGHDISITHNQSGRFINTWVKLDAMPIHGPWLKQIQSIELPNRHGEGRLVTRESGISSENRQPALKYLQDINGSLDQTAGLASLNGRILGLMPHPEAFVRLSQHPGQNTQSVLGLKLFQNAYQFFREKTL
jgi:phosphoribosylformylglycinamidine (FGAM) synthase-like amidotransferase family enzyme